MTSDPFPLLRFLQLTSSTLPVGAYSYSEGVEYLVERGIIHDAQTLGQWITTELHQGSITLEAGVMVRACDRAQEGDRPGLIHWNHWLTAQWETQELRRQSAQMGQSLVKLLEDLYPQSPILQPLSPLPNPCNYAIAFGVGAALGQLDREAIALAYLANWTNNLIGAGVKVIPLGQTASQKLLQSLHPAIGEATNQVLSRDDDQLGYCGWGLSLASMGHETQYSRLFRS